MPVFVSTGKVVCPGHREEHPVSSFLKYASEAFPHYQLHLFQSEEQVLEKITEKILIYKYIGKRGSYVFAVGPICLVIDLKGMLYVWETLVPDVIRRKRLEGFYEGSRNMNDRGDLSFYISRDDDGKFYKYQNKTKTLLSNGARDLVRIAGYSSEEDTLLLSSTATQDKFTVFGRTFFLKRTDYEISFSSSGTDDVIRFSVYRFAIIQGCKLCAGRDNLPVDLSSHNVVFEVTDFAEFRLGIEGYKCKNHNMRNPPSEVEDLVKGRIGERHMTFKRIQKEYASDSDKELPSYGHLPNVLDSALLEGGNYYYVGREDYICTLEQSINSAFFSPRFQVDGMMKGFVREMVIGLLSLHEGDIKHGNIRTENVMICERSTSSYSAMLSGIKNSGSLVDDFANLGKACFFALTGGLTPDWINAKKVLLKSSPEAYHLIIDVLFKSPTFEEVRGHPFLFDSSKVVSFFMDTSGSLQDHEKNDRVFDELRKICKPVFGNNSWGSKLNHGVFRVHDYYKGYGFNDMAELLRAIRNGMAHDMDTPDPIKDVLGRTPPEILNYYRSQFPKLFIEVYKVMRDHSTHREFRERYFNW